MYTIYVWEFAAFFLSHVKIFLFAVVMNVSFGALTFSTIEGNGSVELVLLKTAGAIGPVSVNLFTIDGTAKGHYHCVRTCIYMNTW